MKHYTHIMKHYTHTPKNITNDLTQHLITQMVDDFNSKREKIVIDALFKEYENKYLDVYVISRKEFEHFIKTMMPIYVENYVAKKFS